MKAIDLKLGSIIYSFNNHDLKELFKRDYSTNKDVLKKVITETKVDFLKLSKGGDLLINQYQRTYSSETYYFLTVEPKEFEKSTIERKNTLYFFNKEDCFSLIRKGVLEYLENIEKSIEAFKIEQLEKYKEVQKHYWDYLN